MKLLFSTGSLYDRPLDYVAYVAASSGFDGIELVLNGVWYDKELYKKIMFLERVLPIQAIHAPFDAKSFKEKSISLQKTLEIALDTDAKVVVVHPPNIKLFDFRYYSWFNRYLDKVSFKFDICVEVMPLSLISFFGRIIRVPLYSFSSFTELREFVSSKGLKIAFDTTHVFTYGVSLIDAFEALGSINTIAHVHLSDFTFSKSVCKQHLFPGEGNKDELFGFISYLKDLGYRGFVTFEVLPSYLPKTTNEVIIKLRNFVNLVRGL